LQKGRFIVEDKLLIGIEEAAAAIGLSGSKLRVMLRQGVIPSVKIGQRRMVPRDGLIAYVENLKAEAGSARAMKAVA
jgi:excisionase family DNA binding protein